MRLVQLQGQHHERAVALVEEPRLRLLTHWRSVYEMVQASIDSKTKLADSIQRNASRETLSYDEVWNGTSDWTLMLPLDHPDEPARCLVSGTGLTHLGSAKNRQSMHAASEAETDSMKMFRWGVEGGRPAPGQIGVHPEWFYKGTGTILKAHRETLVVPSFAEDGGEEAELVGLYVIDRQGNPRRVGMTVGNEFSDHVFEKKNYLNLAGSKIRNCSIGPELAISPEFGSVGGEVRIERDGELIWSKSIRSGEAEMCHSLANLEHHHFKFEYHRRPGDVHVHYFGAHSLSFGEGVRLRDADVMVIRFDGFGRSLVNPLRVDRTAPRLIEVNNVE